jgi:hypothetical protein
MLYNKPELGEVLALKTAFVFCRVFTVGLP